MDFKPEPAGLNSCHCRGQLRTTVAVVTQAGIVRCEEHLLPPQKHRRPDCSLLHYCNVLSVPLVLYCIVLCLFSLLLSASLSHCTRGRKRGGGGGGGGIMTHP